MGNQAALTVEPVPGVRLVNFFPQVACAPTTPVIDASGLQQQLAEAPRAAHRLLHQPLWHSAMNFLRSSAFLYWAASLQDFMTSPWRFLPSARQEDTNLFLSCPFSSL